MTRMIAAVAQLGRPVVATFVACVGLVGIAGTGCGEEGIGDPCTPEQEYNPDFLGFDEKEVNVESKSFQCRTRLCLVNHFQGRVTCPYGQDSTGAAPANASACTVPGTSTPVVGAKDSTGAFKNTTVGSTVEPQCLDRTADKAVYCSCRCADINGQKGGGSNYCDCPDGFACTLLVPSVGNGQNEGLTGSYCIKKNTQYDPAVSCSPATGTCTPPNCN